MSDFAAYWDNIIKDWAETGNVPASEAFWFEDQKHLGLHRNLMPEPYWGDIDSNSVVMLNFNPAGAAAEHPADGCHRANRADPSTVCGLMSGCYSAVARPFPLLGGFPIESVARLSSLPVRSTAMWMTVRRQSAPTATLMP